MGKKLSFILLDSSGRKIKVFDCSRPAIIGLSFAAISTLIFLGIAVYHVLALQRASHEKTRLESKLHVRNQEFMQQRLQIQRFEEEIGSIQEQMTELDQLEKQVRTLANLDTKSEEKEETRKALGVGGSSHEYGSPHSGNDAGRAAFMEDMSRRIEQLKVASISHRLNFQTLLNELNAHYKMMARTPSLMPTIGVISSRFGYRKSPFTGESEFHSGIDISNSKGTLIIAPAAGTITFADVNGAFGRLLVMDHGYGLTTRYGHIETFLKKVGDQVERGDKIATMGNSGRSTGSHLHYEVRLNNMPVNPAKYIVQSDK